jgi:hypothetical protein
VFECLAERTIALAQLRRSAIPRRVTTRCWQERMRAVLPACRAQGVTIISNMGAANPLGGGQGGTRRGRDWACRGLRVAVVTGDDVLPWMLAP